MPPAGSELDPKPVLLLLRAFLPLGSLITPRLCGETAPWSSATGREHVITCTVLQTQQLSQFRQGHPPM